MLHLVPVVASVRWMLTVTSRTASSSEFTCTVNVDLHPALRVMGSLMALGIFLKRHVDEETAGFVADISRKHRDNTISSTFIQPTPETESTP